MRLRLPWTLLLSACLLAACDGTVVLISTGPTPLTQSGWTVIIHLSGGTGAGQCDAAQSGQTKQYQLGVDRSSAAVTLALDPTDHGGDYQGSVTDGTVSATGHYYGRDLCGSANPGTSGVPASFQGSFSPDGSTLTGKEIRTATVAGKTYTYEYEWRAELKQP